MPGRPPTRRPRRAGLRRGVTASAALVVVLALAGCASGDLGGTSAAGTGSGVATGVESPSATSPPAGSPAVAPPPSEAELAAITAMLRARAAALVAGDDRAYAASVSDRSSEQGRRQLAAFRAARELRVAHVSVGDVTVDPPVGATDAGTLRVSAPMAYRLQDLDRSDRRSEVSVLLRGDGAEGWTVVSESADGPGAPPWVVMPDLVVRRGKHGVIAGTVPASRLAEHARVVDRSLPPLRRDWDHTPDHVLVLAPSTAREADALLGRTPGSGVAPVAATTEGPTGADARATGDRIVLDPEAHARLTVAGRDVVLTHELAHVAVRASVPGRAAGWLAEGYADHVGYARADVADARLLQPLLAAVRAGAAPVELPLLAELDPGSGAIEVPYLAAWQAVELIVDEHGEGAVRRLLVAGSAVGSEADAEAATDRALQRVLGTNRAELTRAWQQRLRGLTR